MNETEGPLPDPGSSSHDPTVDSVKSLPPLSPAEFRKFNALAERMDIFHDRFRQSWTTLYDACLSNSRPKHLTLKQFLRVGTDFCHELELHHSVEEQYIFPKLAKRMPAFRKNLELIKQHRVIHQGLEKLETYLGDCESREKELRLDELKEIMDEFREVLWDHLDQEVKELGADNMRRFWTLEEMRTIRI